MPQPITFFLGLALVAFCAWMALKPNYVFFIRIRNGKATATKGKLVGKFLRDVEDALQVEQVRDGWIGAVHDRQRCLRLVFPKSWHFGAQQRIRNIWGSYR
jgi:hypothetical protein